MGEMELAEAHEQKTNADSALVTGLRERDSKACTQLYDRFAPGIHRFAVVQLSGDIQSAEDVVVETMVSVAKDIKRFNPHRSTLSTWIYGIARRRVQLEIRRLKRRK